MATYGARRPAQRRQLFEFEDFGWFPALFRDTITRWLADAFRGIYDPVVPLVVRLLDADGTDRVVDLCSGGSGPWEYLKPQVDAARAAAGRGETSLTLTDLYPNVPAFTEAAARSGQGVGFESRPVDARRVPDDLKGVRTLFTAVHHLRPGDVRAVLADAAASGRAIGVFDMSQRDSAVIRHALWQVPLSMARTIRHWQPRRPAQLLLTYAVPLITLTSVWDAVASGLRAYRADELAALTDGLTRPGYLWEAGELRPPGGTTCITYVIGYPVG